MERALAQLDPRPEEVPPIVAGGEGGALVEVTAAGIALHPALLDGPHPLDTARAGASDEGRLLALDRWRRAAGAVLEGIALAAVPEEGAPAWWRRARAVEAADRAAPELGLLWPELFDWYESPARGVGDGRRGAWFVRWLLAGRGGAQTSQGAEAHGRAEPAAWAQPTEDTWRAFGRWLFDPAGAAAGAPMLLSPAVSGLGTWEAAPLSFARLRVDAGPAGAELHVTGALADTVRLVAGERATALVSTVGGGRVSARVEPVGPVGTWILRSGRTEQRFGAARGIELHLRPDGGGEVTLADAFIGPATEDALSLAQKFGVSGTIVGRWKLVSILGDAVVIELGEAKPVGVTVHPRGRFRFAIPAGPVLGRAEGWLARIGGTRWRVRPIPEGVEAEGDQLGPTVVLRFARE